MLRVLSSHECRPHAQASWHLGHEWKETKSKRQKSGHSSSCRRATLYRIALRPKSRRTTMRTTGPSDINICRRPTLLGPTTLMLTLHLLTEWTLTHCSVFGPHSRTVIAPKGSWVPTPTAVCAKNSSARRERPLQRPCSYWRRMPWASDKHLAHKAAQLAANGVSITWC